MTIRKSIVAAALLMTGGLLAGQAVAAETGGYFGVAAGQTKAGIDEDEANSDLAALGLGATTTVEETDTGFKIFGGYQFTRNFAVEGGYTNLGKATLHSDITSGGIGTADGEWTAFSIDLAALGIIPFGDRFSLFGRAGVSIWSLDADFTGQGPGGTATESESKTGVSPLLGLGAAFNITESISLRAEYERHFDVGDEETTGTSDIDLISLGVLFRF
jgi:OOP family OmpA-OmpF porin